MSNQMMNEVDDALRQDRMQEIWREYGPYLIAGVVLAVLFTAAISGWKSWEARQNMASTELMLEYNADANNAQALIEAIPQMRAPHRALSHLSAAGILISEGKNDEALAQYKQAAADKSAPDTLRDLAAVMAARLDWSMGVSAEKADAILKDLSPILKDDKNPWQAHALLQAAMVAANGKQDFKGAQEYLKRIADSKADVPASLQARASALAQLYAQKEAQKATGAPATTEQAG